MRALHNARALAVAAAMTATCGCLDPLRAGGGAGVWIVEDTRQVGPGSLPVPENEVYSAARGAVELTAAIGETVAFQFVVSTGTPPAGPYNVHLSDLAGSGGTIDARSCARLYRVHAVPIERFRSWYPRHAGRDATPQRLPDVLVPWEAPRGGGPLVLETTGNEIVWVELHLPATVDPGLYAGRIELERTGDLAVEFACALRVRVAPVAIPGRRSLPVIARVNPADLFREHLHWPDGAVADVENLRLLPDEPTHQAAIRLVNETMRLLQSHRLNPVLWASFPKFQPRGEREVEIDWEPYDRLVSGWVSGEAFEDRAGLDRWPVPVSAGHPDAQRQGGFETPAYARLLSAYLAACRRHFEERGWLERAFVRIDPPGELTAEALQRVARLGGILRQSETGWRLVAHVPPRSLRGLGWYNAPQAELTEVGTWAPRAMWCEPAALRAERALGREAWFMPDEPPYSGSLAVEAPGVDARAIAWQAYRYGWDAVWIEHAAEFGRSPFEPDRGTGARGARRESLIYPGSPFGLIDTPLASIRLKRLRRGLLDHELLRLLDVHGRSLLAQEVAQQIVRYGHTDATLNHLLDVREAGWPTDPAVFELARGLLLGELEQAFDAAGGGQAPQQIEKLARWASLMNRALRVRPMVEGVRLFSAEGKLAVRALLSVSNATPQPVEGRWQLASPPVGWTPRPAAALTVPPGGRVVEGLTVDLAGLAYNTDGVCALRFEFDSPRHGTFAVAGRLAAVVSPFVEDPPVVDGDLSDWLRGPGNSLADFRLCRTERPAATGQSENVPVAGTRGFVCHDAQRLYVGIVCGLPEGEQPLWQADNDVPIDGAVPWGQDVVEVLIDPSGALEGTSGEIFAIQVKPSGLLLATQGCRTEPPVGRSAAWRCAAQVRVGTSREAWTVELSVPLEAFGPRAAEQPVWGFNVARLDARRGQYSSWSAARRLCYAPQSMGNLILLRP